MSEKKYNIEFAPLQGYTEFVYRNAHNRIFGGVDTYYTPFVRLEKGESFRTRELRDISPENNEGINIIPQLIASSADELKKISELFISNGYKKADINMGCPFPLLVRRHKGAGILSQPALVEEVLKAAEEIKELEFSLKMRLGWDSAEESKVLIPMLNDSVMTHIAVHPRLGVQQYKGETDIDAFEAFYSESKKPVIFNGDIRTISDIENITARFPELKAVMIGRGILANPALAWEYKNGILTPGEKKKKMRQLHDSIFEQYSSYLQGERQLLEKMKPFWEYLSLELEKRTRKKIEKAGKLSQYESAVALAFSQWGKIETDDDSED